MRGVRVLQNSYPFRITHEEVAEDQVLSVGLDHNRLPHGVQNRLPTVGFKSAVSIEIQVKTEVQRGIRIFVGFYVNWRARIELKIGDNL